MRILKRKEIFTAKKCVLQKLKQMKEFVHDSGKLPEIRFSKYDVSWLRNVMFSLSIAIVQSLAKNTFFKF